MVKEVEKLSALNSGHVIDFVANKKPKCPHCGEDFDINENEAYYLYNDDDYHDVECPDCGEEFRVNSISSWTFSTDDQDE